MGATLHATRSKTRHKYCQLFHVLGQLGWSARTTYNLLENIENKKSTSVWFKICLVKNKTAQKNFHLYGDIVDAKMINNGHK